MSKTGLIRFFVFGCALGLQPLALGINWLGDAGSPDWSEADNWDASVPVCASSVVVEDKVTHWPSLDGNKSVTNFTMRDNAELNTSSDTLFVATLFKVEPNGEAPDILVYGGGNVLASAFTIEGNGSFGAIIEVSSATIQTSTQTCP